MQKKEKKTEEKSDIQKFQDELIDIQKKYGFELYAANVAIGTENAEVIPLIKIRKSQSEMVGLEEK